MGQPRRGSWTCIIVTALGLQASACKEDLGLEDLRFQCESDQGCTRGTVCLQSEHICAKPEDMDGSVAPDRQDAGLMSDAGIVSEDSGWPDDEDGASRDAQPPPQPGRWTSVSTAAAPAPRFDHTAVWTGEYMIVWGGKHDGRALDTGGRYDLRTDRWLPTSTIGAPTARQNHSAVWTGVEMIVWGGHGGAPPGLASGARYDPAIDPWRATATTSAASARWRHSAVWTGEEMIVWGGFERDHSGPGLGTGARLKP